MSLTIFAGYQKTLPAVQYALQRSFLSRVLVEGNHYASCFGARGVWFPAPHLVPREGFKNKPVIWRLEWPQYIIDQLVTTEDPSGTISNSDLELAGGLLHLEALAQTFGIREQTVISKTDDLNILFWQQKDSATTEKVPAYLLHPPALQLICPTQ